MVITTATCYVPHLASNGIRNRPMTVGKYTVRQVEVIGQSCDRLTSSAKRALGCSCENIRDEGVVSGSDGDGGGDGGGLFKMPSITWDLNELPFGH